MVRRVIKVLLTVLVVTVLAVSLTACGSGKSPNSDVTYKDGTYTGESTKREFGYEAAEVTIEDGKITDIELKRLTPDDTEVDYDEWTGEGEDDKPNLKQYRIDLANEMIEKQTYEVDAIATATDSSEGWKEAVKNALNQATK